MNSDHKSKTKSVFTERLKLETSNLARILTTMSVNEKCEIKSVGVVKGSRNFWNFVTPLYLRDIRYKCYLV